MQELLLNKTGENIHKIINSLPFLYTNSSHCINSIFVHCKNNAIIYINFCTMMHNFFCILFFEKYILNLDSGEAVQFVASRKCFWYFQVPPLAVLLRTTENINYQRKKVLTNTNNSGTCVCKAASRFDILHLSSAFRASEFSSVVICFPTKPKTQAESDVGRRNSCFHTPVIIRWLELDWICWRGWV